MIFPAPEAVIAPPSKAIGADARKSRILRKGQVDQALPGKGVHRDTKQGTAHRLSRHALRIEAAMALLAGSPPSFDRYGGQLRRSKPPGPWRSGALPHPCSWVTLTPWELRGRWRGSDPEQHGLISFSR